MNSLIKKLGSLLQIIFKNCPKFEEFDKFILQIVK